MSFKPTIEQFDKGLKIVQSYTDKENGVYFVVKDFDFLKSASDKNLYLTVITEQNDEEGHIVDKNFHCIDESGNEVDCRGQFSTPQDIAVFFKTLIKIDDIKPE